MNTHITSGPQLAVAAQAKLQSMVDAGRDRAMKGIEAINAEYGLRHDFMARPTGLTVGWKAKDLTVEVKGEGAFALTQHARGQLLQQAAIPTAFADALSRHDLNDLLRFNLEKLLPRTAPDGLLVRTVGDTAKGILSPSYRIIDGSPLFEAFIMESMRAGLVPHSGEVTDTRAFVQFIQPRVIEVFPGEHVVFGMELKNSDYGNGALALAVTIWRLLCTNGLVGHDMFRKVHLGKRFDGFGEGQETVKLSAKTLELDAATLKSGLADVMKQLPAHVEASVETLRSAGEQVVNVPQALQALQKRGLKKATLDKVKALYETEQPVESLPQQAGAWRFSNVLSLLANSAQGDEAHDLRELAADMIIPVAKA
jgi:hypothetical protein